MAGTPPASPSGLVTRCVVVQVQLKGAGAGVIRCRTTGRRWNQVQANSPGAPDAGLMQLIWEWCKYFMSQEKVVGRGCSDKGGPGQLLEGECEAFQSGDRTEKYRKYVDMQALKLKSV